jgi:hypothetical protein
MVRVPFPSNPQDPRYSNSFLDTCAFDPKYAPEDEAAREIRAIADAGGISILLTHSNQKELEHPNTPEDVKREAQAMIYTLKTNLSPEEKIRKAKIHAVLTGNGSADKYAADAAHVFEAGKYIGYFITTDHRILGKRGELKSICAATIVTPSEWLRIYRDAGAIP